MLDELRQIEFPQLSTGVFADYGGSSPLCQSAIAKIESYLTDLQLYYPTSDAKPQVQTEIEEFKNELLALFNTDSSKYTVIFSNNTTGAIRSLAYSFPFNENSVYCYQADNHNSILGIRKVVEKAKGKLSAHGSKIADEVGKDHSLYAYPLQSNFNGKKYPVEWINEYQKLSDKAHVLVDAAAYAPTCKLDLTEHPADFVVLSLLKMFGSNGGVLLVRNDAFDYLAPIHELPIDEVSIIGARAGLKVRAMFEAALKKSISEHVFDLAKDFANKLKDLKHFNGKPVAQIYPENFNDNIKEQGGIVAFNIFSSDGFPIQHEGIFTAATANSIFVRFGVHCNPGATYMGLKWNPMEIEKATRNHYAACSLTASVMEGRHVGSVRVSFGFPSTEADVDALIGFFQAHFCESEPPKPVMNENTFELERVFIHPIKGCRGVELFLDEEQKVPIESDTEGKVSHRIVTTGLFYDEFWAIADEMSTLLDRRRCPLLAQIWCSFEGEDMIIHAPNGTEHRISAKELPTRTDFTSSTVCHEKISGSIYPPATNEWLTEALGRKAVLVRVKQTEPRPYRCLFTASMEAVGMSDSQIEQLRPNFVFRSTKPFEEDDLVGFKRMLGDDLLFHVRKRTPVSTEAMIVSDGTQAASPLREICAMHSSMGSPVFGVELMPEFRPSRKNPKALVPHSILHPK